MRIFKTKTFAKFADKKQITDADLINAVERANQGLIDANLGGNIIKQRIAKQGRGKSSGYRALILYKIKQKSYFVAVIEKSTRQNITSQEENALKLLVATYRHYTDENILMLLKEGILIEITQPLNDDGEKP